VGDGKEAITKGKVFFSFFLFTLVVVSNNWNLLTMATKGFDYDHQGASCSFNFLFFIYIV
jgi:hypothetical protein